MKIYNTVPTVRIRLDESQKKGPRKKVPWEKRTFFRIPFKSHQICDFANNEMTHVIEKVLKIKDDEAGAR